MFFQVFLFTMGTLEQAIEIAIQAHKGQTDKSKTPYIFHPLRVMNSGTNETEKICGVLHDVIEDSEWSFEDLLKQGFSNEVIEVLKCVTKESKDENYDHFIDRILNNPTAVVVKLNDLRDNMDITRLNRLTKTDFERLNKYLKAYKRLLKSQKQ
jgi:(p)ppGpp synthase/HD superfamily hydrolase